MDMESNFGQMDHSMKDNGKMILLMGMVELYMQMVMPMKVHGSMV
jgi:hypothetical protein